MGNKVEAAFEDYTGLAEGDFGRISDVGLKKALVKSVLEWDFTVIRFHRRK